MAMADTSTAEPQTDYKIAILPERVRNAIRDQEAWGEIFIGWVQLAVVLTWAGLYTISPKTFPAEVDFRPIPWVLGLYFGFTVLRLALAYQRKLPAWFLTLSVVSDMALLLGTMRSFHLQYMQPASFYLKAPTLLYVFIFIALRSLRFEARYVVPAGVAAALGWLVMVAYATIIDPNDSMVTRDYVHYMTSNSILLGAEFDKVISILMVTGILAVSLIRAWRLLVRAVTEGMAAEDLSRFFAPEVAERITSSVDEIQAGQGEFREATIVYIDIRGFTALSTRLDASEVMKLLAEYQSIVVPIIRDGGGSIDKFLGDGIMATFGATQTSDTHAAQAVTALDQVMAACEAWRERLRAAGRTPLEVGAAAASGTLVFGAVGDATRLEYTVIGESVNRAAKLEDRNKGLGVSAICDAQAYDLATAMGYQRSDVPRRHDNIVLTQGADPVEVVVLREKSEPAG